METISSVLHQKNLGLGRWNNEGEKNSSNRVSTQIPLTRKAQEQAFFKRFPTIEAVRKAFAHTNWYKFLGENESRCVNAPTVTLGRLEALYNDKDLAFNIVREQIEGVYQMTASNGVSPNYQAIEMTAHLFVSKHYTCGIYAMELYFANYNSTFKSRRSYMAFDTGDILYAFGASFIPYWQDLQSKYLPRQVDGEQNKDELAGELALAKYISDEVQKLGSIDAFIAQSGMYATGMLTRESIEKNIKLWASYSNKPF